ARTGRITGSFRHYSSRPHLVPALMPRTCASASTRSRKLMSLKKFGVRAAVTGLAAAALVFLPAVAASAHVRVEPDGTAAGSYSQLTFRVPNESPDATTTKLVVKLPTKHPFTSVSVKPTTGWKAHVKNAELPKPVTIDGAKITKAPRTVTWTATKGHDIKQNEYQTFTIMVGPLPK